MAFPKYLRRRQAARYLNDEWGLPTAASTLAKKAVVGGGPAFHSAGRIPLYAIEELDRYAKAKLGKPRRSTSDVTGEPPTGSQSTQL
jgi:hypothetical protein